MQMQILFFFSASFIAETRIVDKIREDNDNAL